VPERYVATDADGFEHFGARLRRWPLPLRSADGWEPGAVVEPDELGVPETLDADGLLDELGEFIYVAEIVADTGAVRLAAGTGWSETVAAGFALDCVGHVLGSVGAAAEARLPGGGTLASVLEEARGFLARGTATEGHRLGFMSRMAAARRLKRQGDEIGSAAFSEAARAEGEDLELMDDPVWETIAAAHEAVFAAIEAVRHVALPSLADRDTRRYEAREESKLPKIDSVDTPWGLFPVGGGGPKYAPSWAAARDAAESARKAVADAHGQSAGQAERTWQALHLVSLFTID